MTFFSVIICLSLLSVVNPLYALMIINSSIILYYFLYKPRNIFHPNNIVFAFSFLYVVLPSTVQLAYDFLQVSYILPWGQPVDWLSFGRQTYFDMYLLFLVLFFSFYFFNKDDYKPVEIGYRVNGFLLSLGYLLTFFLLILYVKLTGGVSYWLTNYKEAFLLGRSGLGGINILILFLVNLMVFLLGLNFKSKKGMTRVWIFILAFVLIISASLLQGLKSRIIILIIIFYFPYLIHMRIRLLNLCILGIAFFIMLYIGTYIRSNGFYDSPKVFLEYTLTYFNIYNLHNLILESVQADAFTTFHHIFVKPLQLFGLVDPNAEYDLSIMFTKQFFPNDWELMNATQQWPIVTELHLNYFGFIFGWIPLIIYTYILSLMYRSIKNGNINLSLIYVLEFIRLFTVQRGVLIPWQMPMYLIFYLLIFAAVSVIVTKSTSFNISK